DLNNLLNNVLNATDLLKDKFSENSSFEELTNQIQHNTILASKIISQIIPQNEISDNSFSKLNLNELINNTIKLVGSNPIKFKTTLPDQEILISGNYSNLQRVLLNLILNAKDSKEKNLKININLENSVIVNNKNFILLSITDNGKGIPKNIINKIFNSGFSTKGDSTQRGLGLYYVKDIVIKHNGFIEVDSKLEVGTTFKIFFPDYNVIDINSNFENKTIIVAEDDNFQREIMSDLLKSMKINVFTASNGIEALDLFYSTKPDLLLIDDKMPGLTGLECVSKIREKDKSSQIVLVTGSSQENNYSNVNSIRVLKKPYNFNEVKLLLKELL
ncbi:MAG: ATP-binding protein, partial [Melioribacteraceae bacterium]|nr:ATP-binding protein [Melioribacteraceae bacterium]